MRRYSRMLSFVSVLVLQGCLLPIPHTSQVASGVRGVVVDRNSGDPISGASVELVVKTIAEDPESFVEQAVTGQDGTYALGPVTRWHLAYCFCVALTYDLFPFRSGGPAVLVLLSVSHPDYRADISAVMEGRRAGHHDGFKVLDYESREGEVVLLEPVRLERIANDDMAPRNDSKQGPR